LHDSEVDGSVTVLVQLGESGAAVEEALQPGKIALKHGVVELEPGSGTLVARSEGGCVEAHLGDTSKLQHAWCTQRADWRG
tara:strand:- start:966 stop:1208 length:243 start_codon:yes stop_codon:yes gene_type:complete